MHEYFLSNLNVSRLNIFFYLFNVFFLLVIYKGYQQTSPIQGNIKHLIHFKSSYSLVMPFLN